MKLINSIFLILVFSLSGNLYAKQERYALVIGNADYGDDIGVLKNPVNDAKAISESLKAKGFDVNYLENSSKREIENAIREFTQLLRVDAIGLFYYAGHGIEVDGENYLIPVNANIETETDAIYEAVSVGRLLDGMDRAGNGLNLIVLDACRNNPYSRRFRSASKGLTMMHPASGSMILYATEPGSVAADGLGKNGLFTEHFLNAINTPGLSVEKAFKKTALAVNDQTNGKQIPWFEGVILGDFYFLPVKVENVVVNNTVQTAVSPVIPAAPSNQSQGPSQELVFWQSVEAKPTIAGYQAYLSTYPQGGFASLAKARVTEFKKVNEEPLLPLTIATTPEDAKVRILNIIPAYYDGIKLKSGNYRIEVTKQGYQRYVDNVQLKNDSQIFHVELKLLSTKPKLKLPNEKPKLKLLSSKPTKIDDEKSLVVTDHTPIKKKIISKPLPKLMDDLGTGHQLTFLKDISLNANGKFNFIKKYTSEHKDIWKWSCTFSGQANQLIKTATTYQISNVTDYSSAVSGGGEDGEMTMSFVDSSDSVVCLIYFHDFSERMKLSEFLLTTGDYVSLR